MFRKSEDRLILEKLFYLVPIVYLITLIITTNLSKNVVFSHCHQFLVYLHDIGTKVPNHKIFSCTYLWVVIKKYFYKHLLNTLSKGQKRLILHYSSKVSQEIHENPWKKMSKKELRQFFMFSTSIYIVTSINFWYILPK